MREDPTEVQRFRPFLFRVLGECTSWLNRASRVRKGESDPLAPFPNLKRLFQTVETRPSAARARAVGKDHEFKKVNDEETKRALFPSNFPPAA
jgi:GST-like protein